MFNGVSVSGILCSVILKRDQQPHTNRMRLSPGQKTPVHTSTPAILNATRLIMFRGELGDQRI